MIFPLNLMYSLELWINFTLILIERVNIKLIIYVLGKSDRVIHQICFMIMKFSKIDIKVYAILKIYMQ